MANPFLLAWGVGLVAVVASIVDQVRGIDLAPKELKLKLRSSWRGVMTRDYMRLAFHDAPEPTRSRLRRSGWARVVLLVCWGIGVVALAEPLWVIAAAGVLCAAHLAWNLLRRAPIG